MDSRWYPLSSPQYDLWMDEQQNPGSFMNVIHAAATIYEEIDELRLERAVNEMVRLNDSFRLHMGIHEGEAGQYLEEYRPFSCKVLDFSKEPEKAEKWLKNQALKGIRLEESNLWEFTIVRLPEGKRLLDARIHHIISDGFNFGLVFEKIFALYEKLGENDPFLEEPSYLDFVLKDQTYNGSEQQEEDKVFWEQYLENVPLAPQIRPDAGQRRAARGREILPLGKSLSEKVVSFAKENGFTPFHVMHSALAVYISRCCQVRDVVLTIPRLNRDTEIERRTLGEFTVAVPVRLRLTPEKTFLELCGDSREQNRVCAAHKKYGYVSILDDLHQDGYEGAPSHFTLSFQQTRLNCRLGAEITLMESTVLANHLTMTVEQWDKDGFSVMYDYFGSLYTQEEFLNIHAVFSKILEEGMKAPSASIDSLPILPDAQKERLQGFQHNPVEYDKSQTIISLFRKQAEKSPDSPAVVCIDGTLSFRELDKASNRVARALIRLGLNKEELVAFMLPRNMSLICCIFGIMKAGGAFVPVDPQYPIKRIEHIVQDSNARFLVSTEHLAQKLGLEFVDIASLLLEPDDSDLELDLQPDNLAYCIYTSGSTGKPKGVLLEHRGINNFTRPDNNPFNRDVCANGRGIVAIGSICFDISLFEIFVTLLNGLFVVLAAEDQLSDPHELAALIHKSGANIMHCTPSRLLSYLNEEEFCREVQGLDIILSAGEAFPSALLRQIKAIHEEARVYNGYGPTETTIGATIGMPGERITIGSPVANVQIYILDSSGRLLPPGCAGEICIGGDGVGRGYLRRPELTAERFTLFEGKRIYHTGDLGYWAPDGQIVFIGRNDHQVKLRGLRIELPEIENCILSYPGVQQAAVLVREWNGSQHLCCFFTALELLDSAQLKKYLGSFLAGYMVPEFLVQLDSMPIAPGGKLDTAALQNYPVEYSVHYEPPATKDEEILCGVFQTVLGLEKVGANDNFFEIGGTSLLAARMMLIARKENISFTYSNVFEYPTPRQLAALKDRNTEAEEAGFQNPLQDYDYTGIDKLLKWNGSTDWQKSEKECGNILLTGATGYLGIHMLQKLLKCPWISGTIYCLIRRKENIDSEKRLKSLLFYYFEENFSDYFGKRLFVLEGDITQEGVFSQPYPGLKIGTVLNCAADVAHYAYGDKLQKTNVNGVKNLLNLSREYESTFVQVSTMSVGGTCTQAQYEKGICLTESSLFIGQRISNQYIETKFLAERFTLEAAASGLPVKIMRVGNLQGRLSDGEFQMNMSENAFTRRLHSYVRLGKAPESLQDSLVQFSPVDRTVDAIVNLLSLSEKCTVFHTYNPTGVAFRDIFQTLEKYGHPIEYIPDRDFQEMVEQFSQTENGRSAIEGLVLDSGEYNYVETPVSNLFTEQKLAEFGFCWGNIGEEYLERYIGAIETLGFFDE